jgi:hypothetical protein
MMNRQYHLPARSNLDVKQLHSSVAVPTLTQLDDVLPAAADVMAVPLDAVLSPPPYSPDDRGDEAAATASAAESHVTVSVAERMKVQLLRSIGDKLVNSVRKSNVTRYDQVRILCLNVVCITMY